MEKWRSENLSSRPRWLSLICSTRWRWSEPGQASWVCLGPGLGSGRRLPGQAGGPWCLFPQSHFCRQWAHHHGQWAGLSSQLRPGYSELQWSHLVQYILTDLQQPGSLPSFQTPSPAEALGWDLWPRFAEHDTSPGHLHSISKIRHRGESSDLLSQPSLKFFSVTKTLFTLQTGTWTWKASVTFNW